MRFRRSVKIFPGFRVNFSASGMSATVGMKGASINFGRKGTYLNTGLPGTGFYNRQRIGSSTNQTDYNSEPQNRDPQNSPKYVPTYSDIIGEIKSADTEQLTSTNLMEVKETLDEAFRDKNEIPLEISAMKRKLALAKTIRIITSALIFGFFIKSLKAKVDELRFEIQCLKDLFDNTKVDIDVHFDQTFQSKYDSVVESYKKLIESQKIWDITALVEIDRVSTRSAASQGLKTKDVKFKYDHIDIIKSAYPAFHLENRNGGDIYIYPAFVIIIADKQKFAIIDINDFQLDFGERRMLTTNSEVPSDSRIVDQTWAYVNKDGSRDKRFKDNYQIPIAQYGGLFIETNSGLNEQYMVSNMKSAADFERAFSSYKDAIKLD